MIINKDLTKEKVCINVNGSQLYAEILVKVHGKWKTECYFKDFGFEIDHELTKLMIKEIYELWGLKAPRLYVAWN